MSCSFIKILCVIPLCQKDVVSAQRLLEWIVDLGGCKQNNALIVADAGTDLVPALRCLEIARTGFNNVSLITNGVTVDGWISGSNSLFKTAAQHANGTPFLFLEPDAVPLCKNWLEKIEQEYVACEKPFMGALVYHNQSNWPNPYFEGVGVYPADTWKRIYTVWKDDAPWTKTCASAIIPESKNSELFQHLWGQENQPPTFADKGVAGTRVFSFDKIRPGAAIYHRCKDHSLICVLKRKFGMETTQPFVTVLPFCGTDAPQALKNIEWMSRLGGHKRYDCIVAYEHPVQRNPYTNKIIAAARNAFRNADVFVYSTYGVSGWPHGANYAFQQVANYIHATVKKPWLWLEADAIPICPEWLDVLQDEYKKCGKLMMGAIIPGLGHCNGTAIYPAAFPEFCKKAMTCVDVAWDWEMKEETIGITHDASHLMRMVWGIENGRAMTHSGESPIFRTKEDVVNWIPKESVLFHRCKDGSLSDRLREMRNI